MHAGIVQGQLEGGGRGGRNVERERDGGRREREGGKERERRRERTGKRERERDPVSFNPLRVLRAQPCDQMLVKAQQHPLLT